MSAATSRFAAIAAFAAAVAVVGALGFFVVLPGAGGALAWEPSYKEAGTELRMVPLGRNASVVAAALQVPFARGVRDGAAPWTLQPAVVPASEPLFVFAPDMEYWDTYLQQEFITLFRNLRGAFRWRQLSVLPGSWGELSAALVAAYGRLPDVLLFSVGFQDDRWAAVARLGPPPAGLTTWIYFDDIHVHAHTGQTNRDNHLAAMTHASLVVTPYAYHLGRAFWPELARKPRLWLPHAAAPIFMVPANAEPQPVILLAGAVDEWYPLRQAVAARIAKGDKRFTQMKHMGYSFDHGSIRSAPFITALHSALATITCGLKIHYIVTKVVEIPATGSLLIMSDDMPGQMERLGFLPWVHYVPYNGSSIDAVADWVLDPANRARVDEMRLAGQSVAWTRHTVAARAIALHEAALATIASTDKRYGVVP